MWLLNAIVVAKEKRKKISALFFESLMYNMNGSVFFWGISLKNVCYICYDGRERIWGMKI